MWMIWPDNAALSILVLALIAMFALYAARAPMHGLLRSASQALGGPLRLGRALAVRRGGRNEGAQQGRAAGAGPARDRPAHRARVRAPGAAGRARPAGLPDAAAQAAGGDHAGRGGLQEVRRGAAAAARLGRRGQRGGQDQDRRRRGGAEDPDRHPPVAREHPRQGAGRIPPRLPDAPQHPGRLHAVLALARQDHEAGRQEHDGHPGRRRRGRRADGELQGDRRPQRRGREQPHQLGVHAVLHRRAGDGSGARRRVRQLQADRAADVRDGRRERLHHRDAAHLRGRGAGDHPGRGLDGPVPDGVAAHHAPVSAHRQPERPHAPAHGVDLAHAAA